MAFRPAKPAGAIEGRELASGANRSTVPGHMKRSTDRILTTHAGSLSRPANLIAISKARAGGESKDDAAFAQVLAAAVADVVRKQRDLGVDIPDDGEFGKPVAGSYDYGAWWNYAFARMSGFSPAGGGPQSKHTKSSVAEVALTSFANRRDWQKFGEFYQDPESSGSLAGQRGATAGGAPRLYGADHIYRAGCARTPISPT